MLDDDDLLFDNFEEIIDNLDDDPTFQLSSSTQKKTKTTQLKKRQIKPKVCSEWTDDEMFKHVSNVFRCCGTRKMKNIAIKLNDNRHGSTYRKPTSMASSTIPNSWRNGQTCASNIAAISRNIEKQNPAKARVHQSNGNSTKPWILSAALKMNKLIAPFQIWYVFIVFNSDPKLDENSLVFNVSFFFPRWMSMKYRSILLIEARQVPQLHISQNVDDFRNHLP